LGLCPVFYSRLASILMNFFSSDVPPIFLRSAGLPVTRSI
jgi:hypothetical protein